MCGIFCQASRSTEKPSDVLQTALQARGPDAFGELTIRLEQHDLQLQFVSTVLALRGRGIVKQPLHDSRSGSVFCWNGEAWKIEGRSVEDNDTQAVFQHILETTRPFEGKNDQQGIIDAVATVLSCVRGPYAFVFFHAKTQLLFYGRDCLGRRSLVQNQQTDSFTLCSIGESARTGIVWSEVEADGVYIIDLSRTADAHSKTGMQFLPAMSMQKIPHRYTFPGLNRNLPTTVPTEVPESAVQAIYDVLNEAVRARVTDIRPYSTSTFPVETSQEVPSRVAVLFSGGLDCSLLARMMHDQLPTSVNVDLLNVAFENPRIHKSNTQGFGEGESPYELCPDRITGRKSHAELQAVCPARQWNLVEIDVPYTDTLKHRETVIALMHPHNTEMDLSIAVALYFAARGTGFLATQIGRQPYQSPARVLLSGLGADELFGGYQRHGTAFARHSFPGLLDELQLDVGRLGKRNLGRDDRVISRWGKEVRFPYLDEDVVSWALSAPVWEKCGFGLASPSGQIETTLDPEKRVLRLVARMLKLEGAAAEKKRAVSTIAQLSICSPIHLI